MYGDQLEAVGVCDTMLGGQFGVTGCQSPWCGRKGIGGGEVDEGPPTSDASARPSAT